MAFLPVLQRQYIKLNINNGYCEKKLKKHIKKFCNMIFSFTFAS